jgi:hypothetical protein
MRRRLPLIIAAVAIAAGTLALAIPFLARNRDYPASIPSPSPLFRVATVAVPRGQSACFENAVAEQHSAEARFRALTFGRPGPPLRLSMTGPGYSRSYDISGGYGDGELRVAVTPPARPTPLRVCIANRGRQRVGLLAANDRARSRSLASVDGRPANASVVFGFWESGTVDVRRRLPDIGRRVTIFRPAFVGSGVVWALALLLVIGVPAAILLALRDADDGPDRGASATRPSASRRSRRRRDPAPPPAV